MQKTFTIRWPAELADAVKQKARAEGRSINQTVQVLLRRWLADEIKAELTRKTRRETGE